MLHVLAEQHAWLSKYCVDSSSSAEELKESGQGKAEIKEPVLSKL